MRAAIVLCVLFVAGCLEPASDDGVIGTPPPAGDAPTPTPSPSPTPSPTPTSPDTTNVAFRTLARDQQGGPSSPQRKAFTDEASWRAAASQYGEAASQQVDFSRETVVAVAIGQRPNGCWSVAVTDADEAAAGETVLEVTTYEPSPTMFCTSVVTYPFHVVALEGADRDVVFSERNATYGA